MTRFHSSSDSFGKLPPPPPPALLKSTSILPCASAARLIALDTDSTSPTSQAINLASPPASLMRASTARPSDSRRAMRITCAPSSANSVAVSSPIPLLPPVTTATLFSRRFVILIGLAIEFSTLLIIVSRCPSRIRCSERWYEAMVRA